MMANAKEKASQHHIRIHLVEIRIKLKAHGITMIMALKHLAEISHQASHGPKLKIWREIQKCPLR